MVSPSETLIHNGGDQMTREQRAAQWRTLVDQQAASGLSAAAFCREHGISLQRFYGWRRRFREQRSVKDSASFVELVPCRDQPHSGVRIRLGDTLSIEVQRGFDPFTLRAVMEAIDNGGKIN